MKNYKLKIMIFILIIIILLITAVIFICSPDSEHVCTKDYQGLSSISIFLLGSIFFSTLPLLFLKETIYNIWKSFAVVAFSLLLLLVFITPQSSGGLFGHTSLFIREEIALYGSILFLILSYIIIVVQAWKTRKK